MLVAPSITATLPDDPLVMYTRLVRGLTATPLAPSGVSRVATTEFVVLSITERLWSYKFAT